MHAPRKQIISLCLLLSYLSIFSFDIDDLYTFSNGFNPITDVAKGEGHKVMDWFETIHITYPIPTLQSHVMY